MHYRLQVGDKEAFLHDDLGLPRGIEINDLVRVRCDQMGDGKRKTLIKAVRYCLGDQGWWFVKVDVE